MALSAENRLKSASLISLVSKKGASWKTPFFRAVFFPEKKKTFKAVVIVSKKYDKRAVARNTIRRKITGILQQEKINLPFMMVIFPYDSAKEIDSSQLKAEILKMTEKIKNWNFSRPAKKIYKNSRNKNNQNRK
jgi:ribonuclease P protein component